MWIIQNIPLWQSGSKNTFPATNVPQNFSISSEIPQNSFTPGTNSLRIAKRHIQPVFNFSPDAKSATKKNNYEHTNIFLIELNYNLTEYIYYPGSYGDTWSDFMMPAYFPIGYITCPEVWRKPIDFIKENLIDDLFELSNKIYIYGPPYQTAKPKTKRDSLLIKAEKLLKLQGKDPKKFFDRLFSNRDSIHVTKFSRPYVAVGAIHAMREKNNGKRYLVRNRLQTLRYVHGFPMPK